MLKNDSLARDIYQEKSLTHFWCDVYESYTTNVQMSFRILLPFAAA